MAHIIIVGAGAAGLYAAGHAVQLGQQVTLVEHMDKPGKKLAITGKGRCNLTNDCAEDEFLKNVRHNPRFLYSAIYGHSPAAVMDLFEHQLGVALKTERGRRVFPQSDEALEVVNALLRFGNGAQMVKGRAVELLLDGQGAVQGVQLADGRRLTGDAVLVATGGLSYPVTGSTGIGYALAEQAGHSIVAPLPSLVSLMEKGKLAGRMAGLSLKNVELTLWEGKKAVFKEQGEMIFTHFGLSGPMVLSASAYLGDMNKHEYMVSIDMKPALSMEQLDARLLRDFAEMPNKEISSSLDKLLPNSMRPVMLDLWSVDPSRKINQITRAERLRLAELVKKLPIPIAGRGDLDHAVITAGGVNVKQVDPKTMASKMAENLYFAGEVLDVDAYTGGYNLQIAWSTAYAAVQGIREKYKAVL